MSKVAKKVRSTVYERDGGQCCSCGMRNLTLNHRMNRQMGGSKLRDGYENLVTMCSGCNTALEADASFRESGIRMGWKIQSWDDPLRIPVYYQPFREWRLLDWEGGYTAIPEEEIRRGTNGTPLV